MKNSIELTSLLQNLKKSKENENNVEESEDSFNQELTKNFSPEELRMLSQLYSKDHNFDSSQKTDENFKTIFPDPGFCLKTKNSKQDKVFINVCKSTEINSPEDISEKELIELIEQNDTASAAFRFRVPMSLGEPHSELDNSGCACIAYDVCINPDFFDKIQKSATFMGFFMSIVIEGLEEKYTIKLDRNFKMLKNKKFIGKIQQQYIRKKSKPLIAELNKNKAENDIKKKSEIPKYRIFKEPQDRDAEYLVAEIELPQIISSKSILLDIGEDRILLNTRSDIYFLDIYLPYYLVQEECGAQFDRKTKILTITMPVAKF